MSLQETTVTLSEAGIKLVMMESEHQDNARTIRRLEAEIRDRQERLKTLKKRQEQIEQIRFNANQLNLPGLH